MRRWLYGLCLLSILVGAVAPPNTGAQTAGMSDRSVERLLAQMSVSEKVGQLFLVTFYGPGVAGTEIERLIGEYHVGGVVLAPMNDNITSTLSAPQQIFTLTQQLQTAAIDAAGIVSGTPTTAYVPLLIAVSDWEELSRLNGLTTQPTAMAMGATWDPDQAEAMGQIAGQELAALGINLLIGPTLDVLEQPRPQGWDIGPEVFGGNPFWVGQMGQAYLRGVHAGSNNRVAVAPLHFPGLGGSDRDPALEMPTLSKSARMLQGGDLIPFLAVASQAPGTFPSVADALVTAHVRLQGFQDVQPSTPPVSFDQQALGQLLDWPGIKTWRAGSGVTISGPLGAGAVKQFYAPFKPLIVARDAFMAGNDLLYLADFGQNPRAEQYQNIVDTLTYFAQRYGEDQTFAAKVDAAVGRILKLKLRVYATNTFTPEKVLVAEAGLSELGQGQEAVLALAHAASTFIGPAGRDVLAAPQRSEKIVFFTDTRTARACAACEPAALLDRRALERAVLRLYGPEGIGQVRESDLQSFTFNELNEYLQATAAAAGTVSATPEVEAVALALEQADWIGLAMVGQPASAEVSTFLTQRADLVRDRRIVALAFGAPYYLDTTDLIKFSAFYALYSPAPEFAESAARVLFRELVPAGAAPVSVPGVGYDLAQVVQSDPARPFEISLQRSTGATLTPQAMLKIGDTVRLQTQLILDHNGRGVPDGMPVQFTVTYQGLLLEVLNVTTVNGEASADLTLKREGELEIKATSGQANSFNNLKVSVGAPGPSIITVIPPTAVPSASPEPTFTFEPPTPVVTATPPPEPPGLGNVDWRDFIILCLGLVAVVASGYQMGAGGAAPHHRWRVALCGAIGILGGYNLAALGLPGGAVVYMFLGAAVGLVGSWYVVVYRGRLLAHTEPLGAGVSGDVQDRQHDGQRQEPDGGDKQGPV